MSFDAEVKRLSKNLMTNVSVLRSANELSMRGFAKATGVSATTIRRIELARKTHFGRGKQGYTPSLSTIVKIARSISATPDQLLLEKF